MFGMYHDTYFSKAKRRKAPESDLELILRNLEDPYECYNMFRMSREIFDKLQVTAVASSW